MSSFNEEVPRKCRVIKKNLKKDSQASSGPNSFGVCTYFSYTKQIKRWENCLSRELQMEYGRKGSQMKIQANPDVWNYK